MGPGMGNILPTTSPYTADLMPLFVQQLPNRLASSRDRWADLYCRSVNKARVGAASPDLADQQR